VAMDRIKVCLIATHFAEYAFCLARSLARHAEVLLILNRENAEAELEHRVLCESIEGVQFRFMRKHKNPFRIPGEALSLAKAVRSFRPDVIHVQEDSKDALSLALPFFGGAPLVLTMHDPKPHSGDDSRVRNRTRHGAYIRQLRALADAVIVHGNALVRDVPEALARSNVETFVIPHGPLGLDASPSRPVVREIGRFLFFGRIEAYKGLEYFIAAVRSLRDRGVDARGVIAGRGSDLERHRGVIAANECFELINRFLSPAEVTEQFLMADAIVMPYVNATQSGVAAYAMGLGRPVVSSDVGAIREIVRDRETGLLVPPRDVPALTEAMAKIVEDRSLAERLGDAARRQSKEDFSWGTIACQTLAAYQNVLAVAHRRRISVSSR
jgi:glycosyltransferase involved in cell wall biosynthesis